MSEQAGTEHGRSLAGYPRTSRRSSGAPAAGAGLAGRMGLRPGAPGTVRVAVRLMLAAAVLDIAAVVTIALTRTTARSGVLASHSVAIWHLADLRLTEDMIAAPVLALVWAWLATVIGHGRDWGRFAVMVLVALDTAGIIAALVAGAWHYVAADFALGAAVWLTGLTVLTLVFHPRSGRYFEQAARR